MRLINDDPIIRSIERTGYPPWMQDDEDEEIIREEDEDDDEWCDRVCRSKGLRLF